MKWCNNCQANHDRIGYRSGYFLNSTNSQLPCRQPWLDINSYIENNTENKFLLQPRKPSVNTFETKSPAKLSLHIKSKRPLHPLDLNANNADEQPQPKNGHGSCDKFDFEFNNDDTAQRGCHNIAGRAVLPKRNGNNCFDDTSSATLSALFSNPTDSTISPPHIIAEKIITPASTNNDKTIICNGIDRGNFGDVLSFVGKALANTANFLLGISEEEDGGRKRYMESALSKSKSLILPFRRMIVEKLPTNDGYAIFSPNCNNWFAQSTTGKRDRTRCDPCDAMFPSARKQIKLLHQPNPNPYGPKTRIDYIASNKKQAEMEIRRLREQLKEALYKKAKLKT